MKQDLIKANIFQDASGYEVYIMIPGIASKYDIRLQINFNPRTWVVSGVIPNFNPKMPCVSLEFPPGEFRREGKIPDYVDIQKVQKDYINGVLKLTWFAHNQEDSRIVSWEDEPLAKQPSTS